MARRPRSREGRGDRAGRERSGGKSHLSTVIIAAVLAGVFFVMNATATKFAKVPGEGGRFHWTAEYGRPKTMTRYTWPAEGESVPKVPKDARKETIDSAVKLNVGIAIGVVLGGVLLSELRLWASTPRGRRRREDEDEGADDE